MNVENEESSANGATSSELLCVGSKWRHRNGASYTVIMLTNLYTESPEVYPITVVYRGDNGKVWSRPLNDWHRSMTADT